MVESEHYDDDLFLEWDEAEEEDEPLSTPWRRPVLIAVAAITALAIVLVPLYNVVFSRSVADNGLEICGFDYCIVQDAVREAGLDLTMSRLSNTFLTEEEASSLANELTAYLGIEPVGLQVVEDLERLLGGIYDPDTRSISVESPARAWTVLHEVAHAVQGGHGDGFRDVVIDLTSFMESSE